MKRKNLLKLMAVVMILAMAMTMLIACNTEPETEPEPEKKPTAQDAANEISTAIINSLGKRVDVTRPIGFEYALYIPNDKGEANVNVKGVLDTKNAKNTKLYIDFIEDYTEINRVFSISTDDKYMYFDSLDAKKKFRGFDLANKLVGVSIPGYDDINEGMIGSLPGIVFDLLMDLGDEAKFEREVDEIDGSIINTIYGSLSGVAPLLGSVVDGIIPGVGAQLGELLGGINIELTVGINADKEVDFADLVFKTESGELPLTFESKLANIGDEWAPEFYVPAQYDTRYVETNLINFAVSGDVRFNTNDVYLDDPENLGSVKFNKATYKYELKMDINPFEMLDKAVVTVKTAVRDDKGAIKKDDKGNDMYTKSVAFDVTKLFDITDGGFYFNVYHDCATAKDGGGNKATCDCGKMAAGNGSVLSVAFSPRDFGNNNMYVSANLRAFVPKNIVSNLIGANLYPAFGSMIEPLLMNFLPEGQQVMTFDMKALLGSAGDPVVANPDGVKTASATTETAMAGMDDYNPVGTILDALEFIGGITYSDENGVKMPVAPIVNAMGTLNDLVTNKLYEVPTIGPILKAAKGTGLKVHLDDVVRELFMDADYIQFTKANATFGSVAGTYNFKDNFMKENNKTTKNIDPIAKVEPVMTATGALDITAPGVTIYDENGKMLPLSANEWKAIVSGGTIKVKYTTLAGVVSEPIDIKIYGVSGMNYDLTDKAQEVIFLLNPLEGYFDYLNKTVGALGINVSLPVHQFVAKVTVSALAKDNGAVFSQKSDLANKYDAKKEYKTGDAIDTTFDLTLTYKNGAKKVYPGITPTSNDIIVKDGKVNAVENFKLGYDKLGYTQEIELKVVSKQSKTITEKIDAGSKYTIKTFDYKIEGTEEEVSIKYGKKTLFNEKNLKLIWKDGVAPRGAKVTYGFNSMSFEFSEVGEYEVSIVLPGGFINTYKFSAGVPGAPAPAPSK